jgi:hypothetical protein
MKARKGKDKYLTQQIEELDFSDPKAAKLKREEKQILKKARKKHTRNMQRRELRDIVKGDD